nr:MAG TPA: hypothetical protein [Caudoviricetes sp.]
MRSRYITGKRRINEHIRICTDFPLYLRRGVHCRRGGSRSDGRDAYDDYMTQKQSYRSGKSEDCKRKMLAALEEHLDELTTEMSDMSKDAECREERDLVKRYVEKLRDML